MHKRKSLLILKCRLYFHFYYIINYCQSVQRCVFSIEISNFFEPRHTLLKSIVTQSNYLCQLPTVRFTSMIALGDVAALLVLRILPTNCFTLIIFNFLNTNIYNILPRSSPDGYHTLSPITHDLRRIKIYRSNETSVRDFLSKIVFTSSSFLGHWWLLMKQ